MPEPYHGAPEMVENHTTAVLQRYLDALAEDTPADVELCEGVPAPASSGSGLTPDARRILETIDGLPADEREAFCLIRVQGLLQEEAAEVLGVSISTVQRRLYRAVLKLTRELDHLRPP